jgi:hypothetical protein
VYRIFADRAVRRLQLKSEEAERRQRATERRQQATELKLLHSMHTTVSACQLADKVMEDTLSWEEADGTTAILAALGTSSNAVAHATAQLAAAREADGSAVLASWQAMAHKELSARQRQPVPGAKRRKSGAPRTGTEGVVQLGMGWVIRMIQQHCSATCWHLHDTSASGLNGKQGPVDYCFMADAQLTTPAQVSEIMRLNFLLSNFKFHTP